MWFGWFSGSSHLNGVSRPTYNAIPAKAVPRHRAFTHGIKGVSVQQNVIPAKAGIQEGMRPRVNSIIEGVLHDHRPKEFLW
jgi:hypothetical protein